MVQAGVPPDVTTDAGNRGDAPLHWASSFGHVGICALLLGEGAHTNLRNSEGIFHSSYYCMIYYRRK